MPTLETNARNAAADGVVDLIDIGSTDAQGDLVFETSGDVEVALCTFSAPPAYGAAAAGVAQENPIADDTSAVGGLIEHATIRDRDNVKIMELTCSAPAGGGDVEITGGLTVGVGATVSVSDLSVTMPAT